MKVNEIFVSIDGEVNYFHQGHLTTFLRLAGCNMNPPCKWCFGLLPGRRKPNIMLSTKPMKKINEVKKEDMLLTFDDNKNLVETKVMDILEREVDIWYRIKIENTSYYVTPEHPFFTTKGLVKASELQIGDMIYHASPDDKMSFSKLGNNNPMKRSEVAKKKKNNTDYKKVGASISKTIKRKQLENNYQSSYSLLPQKTKEQLARAISERQKGSGNVNWKEDYLFRNYDSLKAKVRKGEINICSICRKLFLFPKDNPRKGRSKYGLDVHHKDGNNKNDSPDNLIVCCESCHYSEHKMGYNFWKGERKDGKQLFLQNGKEVQTIKLIDRSTYPPSTRPKPLKVYNFTCSPYPSYLVDYMWVHNCDTPYALSSNDGSDMTVEEIFDKIEKIGCKKVTITGGSPLVQKEEVIELVNKLLQRKYDISIETNGSISIGGISNEVSLIVDYKCANPEFMLISNFYSLTAKDFIKFVISNEQDYKKALEIKHSVQKDAAIKNEQEDLPGFAFSPITPGLDPGLLAGWLIRDKEFDSIVNIQIHKIINVK